MAEAANDVLSHGIVEHDDDIEVTQTSQARSSEESVTSRQPGSIEQVKNIPVTKARDWEANVRMNQAEYLRQVSLQSPSQPGELKHATSSQQSRLKPAQTLARRNPSPTAMAGQISMTPDEFHMLERQEDLKTLAKIGASDDSISKAVDDEWAFADDAKELTPNTNARSTGSSASENPAAPKTMTKATQCTTTAQADAANPKVRKIQQQQQQNPWEHLTRKQFGYGSVVEHPSADGMTVVFTGDAAEGARVTKFTFGPPPAV